MENLLDVPANLAKGIRRSMYLDILVNVLARELSEVSAYRIFQKADTELPN